MNYVYIRSEPGLWTVGFYDPEGRWQPESDHTAQREAAERVAWLNGSRPTGIIQPLPAGIAEALNSGDGTYRP